MKRIFVWFFIFLKRQFRSPAFCVILCIPVLFALFFNGIEKKEPNTIQIGLVWKEIGGLSKEVGESLLEKQGMFVYKRYEKEEDLKQAVERREVECGYILPEDLEYRLDEKNFKKLIVCLESPATFLSKVTDEILFSSVFLQYSEKMAIEYGMKQEWADIEDTERIAELFWQNIQDGNTFSFQYETIKGEVIQKEENKSMIPSPIRGIGSVLILAAGLMGAIRWRQDERRGLFASLSPEFRTKSLFLSVFAPIFLFGLSVLLSVGITEGEWKGGIEFVWMFCYWVGVTGFSSFLGILGKKEQTICGFLPILTLGSFLFCPVFFRIGNFIPFVRIFEKLFLPYYYLEVTGGDNISVFLIVCILLFLFGMGFAKRMEK